MERLLSAPSAYLHQQVCHAKGSSELKGLGTTKQARPNARRHERQGVDWRTKKEFSIMKAKGTFGNKARVKVERHIKGPMKCLSTSA